MSLLHSLESTDQLPYEHDVQRLKPSRPVRNRQRRACPRQFEQRGLAAFPRARKTQYRQPNFCRQARLFHLWATTVSSRMRSSSCASTASSNDDSVHDTGLSDTSLPSRPGHPGRIRLRFTPRNKNKQKDESVLIPRNTYDNDVASIVRKRYSAIFQAYPEETTIEVSMPKL